VDTRARAGSDGAEGDAEGERRLDFGIEGGNMTVSMSVVEIELMQSENKRLANELEITKHQVEELTRERDELRKQMGWLALLLQR
jgi:FtsZ-binding cell division protein ZapB